MSDNLDAVAERTMKYTLEILEEDPTRWPVARRGVERILADLETGAPGHRAIERLRRFLAERQADYDEGRDETR